MSALMHSGSVRVRYATSKVNVSDLPAFHASQALRDILVQVVNNPERFPRHMLRYLSPQEFDMLERVLYRCDVYGGDLSYVLGRDVKRPGERDKERLSLLIGEINAGNNSPQIRREGIELIRRMKRTKQITFDKYNEALSTFGAVA